MIVRSLFLLLTLFLPSLGLAFSEEKFAEALGLELVSNGNPFNFLGINRMYTNDDMSRQLLIADDIPGELKETRIVKAKGYLILEVPKTEKFYSSMALVGISEEEINRKIKTTSVLKKFWYELIPIQSAYASDCPAPGTQTKTGLEGTQEYWGSSFSQGALACISGALQGAWEATGGLAVSAWDGIKELMRDPETFWDKKVEQVKNLKNFIMHFDTKMKELSVGLANLPAEMKTQLICGFVGGLAADAALAILLGGAGAAKVILRIEDYIGQVMKLEKVFKVMNSVGKLREIPINFWQNMSSGKIPRNVIDSIRSFADHNLPDVIQGAMQCAL